MQVVVVSIIPLFQFNSNQKSPVAIMRVSLADDWASSGGLDRKWRTTCRKKLRWTCV